MTYLCRDCGRTLSTDEIQASSTVNGTYRLVRSPDALCDDCWWLARHEEARALARECATLPAPPMVHADRPTVPVPARTEREEVWGGK